MNRRDELFLHHEVMLLSLKDEKGTMESGACYLMALGAAILAELLLRGRIEVEQEKKKKFARVISTESLGDEVLDECLRRIDDSKKRQQLRTWVARFAQTKKLKDRVAGELCNRGILRADQDKVLFVFTRRIYPELDPRPEREIVERLKKAIFGAGSVDPRTVTLIAIAQRTNLLKNAFEKKRLKERKERIERITSGSAVGAAAKEAVEAAQAAVIAATTVTTTG